MVGSAVVRRLASESIGELIVAGSDELDLRSSELAHTFLRENQPELVIVAAARVGGIHANRSAQADFLYDNIMISTNVLHACQIAEVEKVVVLGSSCIYPRDAQQPIKEDYLLTGPLEATNEGYAIAKIAALEYGRLLRQQYGMDVISLMPTNLYGPGDNYDLQTSHVLPALLRKTHEAAKNRSPTIEIWGSGTPRREFLHVDDVADAVVFAAQNYSGDQHLNIGAGRDLAIIELAELIASIVGWSGTFVLNPSMPDGTPRKLLDSSKITELGWRPSIGLREGIEQTYQSFLAEHDD